MTDSPSNPDPQTHDQDAEPPLTGPGESGPTGVDEAVDGAAGSQGGAQGGNEDAEDQDAQPSRNAPEA